MVVDLESKKIKVVHLVAGSLSGGAARGAYWLHKGLLRAGVDSHIITNHHDDLKDPSISSLSKTKFRRLISILVNNFDSLLLVLFPQKINRIFSTGFLGIDYTSCDKFKEADIVHLHWINGLVSTRSIGKIKKPVVWTLRDMWPITGGCHYSLECDKYKFGCGKCPQLKRGYFADITKLCAAKKRKAFSNIVPVGISEWLTEEANRSFVFGGDRAVTINNNIDFSLFFPIEKKIARAVLGLATTKKIILAGATDTKDFYKGFGLFLESLSYLDRNEYLLCVFGKPDIHALESTRFEYKALGYLNDDISLRIAYSASDVFVAPSIQEAFGKTLVESLACMTPVVCFDATGPAGIIEHKVDGYKAQPFDPKDLAKGVEWVLKSSNYSLVSQRARENAIKKFDAAVIAEEYKKLYINLLFKEAK